MSKITLTRLIDAPLERVFKTVSDIDEMSRAVPHLIKVEFLTEARTGVGARFRETRVMKGREASTELEVTEYVENDHVRMVSDEGGTIWDTVFSVRPVDGKTELTMRMDARPYKLIARAMLIMITGIVTKAIGTDMDAVKAYCEDSDKA